MPVNRRVVIDNSVSLKWVHEEEGTNKAQSLLQDIHNQEVIAVVPDLIFYEFSNVLIRGIGKSLTEAQQAVDTITLVPWRIVTPTTDLIKDAMQFAAERPKLSLYDAAYVAVALYYDAVVITADTLFHKTVGKPLTQLL